MLTHTLAFAFTNTYSIIHHDKYPKFFILITADFFICILIDYTSLS